MILSAFVLSSFYIITVSHKNYLTDIIFTLTVEVVNRQTGELPEEQ